jgi:hypothetical protein
MPCYLFCITKENGIPPGRPQAFADTATESHPNSDEQPAISVLSVLLNSRQSGEFNETHLRSDFGDSSEAMKSRKPSKAAVPLSDRLLTVSLKCRTAKSETP